MSAPTILEAVSDAITKSRVTAKWYAAEHRWTIVRWLSPIVILLVWQLGSATGIVVERVLPAPSLVLESGLGLIRDGQSQQALQVSGGRVVKGLLVGGLLGIALGTVVGLSKLGEAVIDPPLQMVRPAPSRADPPDLPPRRPRLRTR